MGTAAAQLLYDNAYGRKRVFGPPVSARSSAWPATFENRAIVQRKDSCACGGGCSRCSEGKREPEHAKSISGFDPLRSPTSAHLARSAFGGIQRVAGTDRLDEMDTTVPHAMEDAFPSIDGSTSPTPMTPPAAPPASCCDQAIAGGLMRSDYGAVICCNNVKHSCVHPANFSGLSNATARSIATGCAREHEDTHQHSVDCTGAAVERPNWRAGENIRAGECTAYRAESACLTRRLPDCGSDAECTTQINARIVTKDSQAAANC
jgi:hypothetical protein